MMTSMPRSFWTETRMLCKKDGKAEIWHGVKNLWLGWHLSRILPGTFILLPSNLCIWKKTPTFVSVFSFISSLFLPGFFRTPLSYSLSNLCMQKGLTSLQVLFLYQQLPILPGRFRPSTFGVCELNFRVRHGYGWSSQLSPLFLWESVLSKPYRRSPEVIRLSRCF